MCDGPQLAWECHNKEGASSRVVGAQVKMDDISTLSSYNIRDAFIIPPATFSQLDDHVSNK